MHTALFLDRDGTINEEVDYLSSVNQLRLIDGSAEAIREANQLGLKVFIITNQSGIARGMLTEHNLKEVHTKLLELLNDNNAHVDAIYYCPHHPDAIESQYRKDCDCRKPNIGMLTKAQNEFNIDLKKSFVIGDRAIDIQTGNNAGATSILVLTGYGKEEQRLLRQHDARADYIAENLYDAVQYVKQQHLPVS